MEDIRILLNQKRIELFQYKAYLRFGSDEGRKFLTEMIHAYCMELPVSFDGETGFSWQAGRLSIWREMQFAIDDVDKELKKGVTVDE